MSPGTLVAGVGNIFLADDGFGVEVARRLAQEPLPAGTQVADYGIRGVHLAYQLLEGYERVILVDALSRGEAPGTVFVFEPDLAQPPPEMAGSQFMDGHGLDPATVLALVKQLGGVLGRVLVVGCEPAELVERIGLSPPVERAVEEATLLVRQLLSPEGLQTRQRGDA